VAAGRLDRSTNGTVCGVGRGTGQLIGGLPLGLFRAAELCHDSAVTTPEEITAFKQHRIWGKSDSLAAIAATAVPRSPSDKETIARALAVAKYVKAFKAIEPYLFSSARESQAETLSSYLDTIEGQIAGWDQSAAMLPPTMAAIDTSIDSVLSALFSYQWPPLRRGREDILTQTADAYRTATDQSLASVEEQVAVAKTELAAIQQSVALLTTDSEARAIEAATAVAAIAEVAAAQSENASASLQIELKKVDGEASAQRDELAKRADALIVTLESARDSGNKLLANVADQATAGAYLDFANKELAAYRLWNILGGSAVALAFVFLAAVFLGPLLEWWPETDGTESVVLKVGITVSLAGFSAYAFREAGKRMRQSIEARYRNLDVVALPSFAKDLKQEKQDELRYLMGVRLFGSSVKSASGSSKSRDSSNTLNLAVDPETVRALAEGVNVIRNGPTL
jgi:hypothetical protein